MNEYKSFAVTVIGSSHIKTGLVCQDASNWHQDTNISIAVVADGHGDNNCFRSDLGAKFAVAAATEGIKQFVKDTESFFKPAGNNKKITPIEFEKLIREKLIKQTVAAWNKSVMENHKGNPFSEQELEGVKQKYLDKFEKGESINKAYGTSLIAAVITPWYWFAYHIGDGRFSVLYPDGSGEQPVIFDEKCFLNVTTSICDDDVLEREQKDPKTGKTVPAGVRSFLSFHAVRPPPIAFFLCTDGIDDNYPVEGNEKHLYRLYRTIAITFAEDGYDSTSGKDGISGQLKDLANQFATRGKGDDTSIAGIVNIKELKKVAPTWKENIATADAKRAEDKKIAEEKAAEERAEVERIAAEKEAKRAEREAEANESAESSAYDNTAVYGEYINGAVRDTANEETVLEAITENDNKEVEDKEQVEKQETEIVEERPKIDFQA